MDTERPLLLRTSEVARALGTNRNRVRDLIRSGELGAIRFGGSGYHRGGMPARELAERMGHSTAR